MCRCSRFITLLLLLTLFPSSSYDQPTIIMVRNMNFEIHVINAVIQVYSIWAYFVMDRVCYGLRCPRTAIPTTILQLIRSSMHRYKITSVVYKITMGLFVLILWQEIDLNFTLVLKVCFNAITRNYYENNSESGTVVGCCWVCCLTSTVNSYNGQGGMVS